MKRFLLAGMAALVLSACGEDKDAICACIEAGDKLNVKANKILQNGSTEKDEQELQALKADKKKKCAEFERMGGDEMKKRMESCGEE
jgi:hypothetical protein